MRGRGFTLIEVLVALAIVAIGMAAVLGALGSSANTTMYLRDRSFAEWVALNRIAQVRLQSQGQPPQTGNTEGDVDFANTKWHWRQEVVATQVQGMVRIDVKVRPADIKAQEDNGWFATVTGMAGDAVAMSDGFTPVWDGSAGAAGPGGSGTGTTGGPGTSGAASGKSGASGSSGSSGTSGGSGTSDASGSSGSSGASGSSTGSSSGSSGTGSTSPP